ncbi:hypothetical protein Droror1_Dr00025006 [Drosera rotundifolia]
MSEESEDGEDSSATEGERGGEGKTRAEGSRLGFRFNGWQRRRGCFGSIGSFESKASKHSVLPAEYLTTAPLSSSSSLLLLLSSIHGAAAEPRSPTSRLDLHSSSSSYSLLHSNFDVNLNLKISSPMNLGFP